PRSPGPRPPPRLRQGGDAERPPRVEASGERDDRRRRKARDAALRRQGTDDPPPSHVSASSLRWASMTEFTRDKTHWLRKLSPDEWIAAALGELARAEKAWSHGDARGGIVGLEGARRKGLHARLDLEH